MRYNYQFNYTTGPNAHLSRQQLFDALVATDSELQHALQLGHISLPTIRILRAGTFTEFRTWWRKILNIAFGQIKVPLVMVNPAVQEWILDKVVQEL